jgi:electron transport complex protein RnfG
MKKANSKPEKTQSDSLTKDVSGERKAEIKTILTITIKLLIISAVTALMLASVNSLTYSRISANAAAEKAGAIKEIFPNADENEQLRKDVEGVDNIWLVFSSGDLLGYAASVKPNGFGGQMDVMIGVNSDGTLAGIKIISHSETPGIGNRINDQGYLSQYVGRQGQLSIGDNNGIDAITGATISSKALLDGVNKALKAYSSIFTENDVIADGGAK